MKYVKLLPLITASTVASAEPNLQWVIEWENVGATEYAILSEQGRVAQQIKDTKVSLPVNLAKEFVAVVARYVEEDYTQETVSGSINLTGTNITAVSLTLSLPGGSAE